MTDIFKHMVSKISARYAVLARSENHICSFTEFFPFCHKRYFFSNYKDFHVFAQA